MDIWTVSISWLLWIEQQRLWYTVGQLVERWWVLFMIGRSRHILYQPYINNILKLYMKFQNLSTYRYWEINKILKDSLEKRKNIGWLFWLLWPHLKLASHEVASSNSQRKPVVSLTWRSRWQRFGHLQLLNIHPVQNSGWLQDQVCVGCSIQETQLKIEELNWDLEGLPRGSLSSESVQLVCYCHSSDSIIFGE